MFMIRHYQIQPGVQQSTSNMANRRQTLLLIKNAVEKTVTQTCNTRTINSTCGVNSAEKIILPKISTPKGHVLLKTTSDLSDKNMRKIFVPTKTNENALSYSQRSFPSSGQVSSVSDVNSSADIQPQLQPVYLPIRQCFPSKLYTSTPRNLVHCTPGHYPLQRPVVSSFLMPLTVNAPSVPQTRHRSTVLSGQSSRMQTAVTTTFQTNTQSPLQSFSLFTLPSTPLSQKTSTSTVSSSQPAVSKQQEQITSAMAESLSSLSSQVCTPVASKALASQNITVSQALISATDSKSEPQISLSSSLMNLSKSTSALKTNNSEKGKSSPIFSPAIIKVESTSLNPTKTTCLSQALASVTTSMLSMPVLVTESCAISSQRKDTRKTNSVVRAKDFNTKIFEQPAVVSSSQGKSSNLKQPSLTSSSQLEILPSVVSAKSSKLQIKTRSPGEQRVNSLSQNNKKNNCCGQINDPALSSSPKESLGYVSQIKKENLIEDSVQTQWQNNDKNQVESDFSSQAKQSVLTPFQYMTKSNLTSSEVSQSNVNLTHSTLSSGSKLSDSNSQPREHLSQTVSSSASILVQNFNQSDTDTFSQSYLDVSHSINQSKQNYNKSVSKSNSYQSASLSKPTSYCQNSSQSKPPNSCQSVNQSKPPNYCQNSNQSTLSDSCQSSNQSKPVLLQNTKDKIAFGLQKLRPQFQEIKKMSKQVASDCQSLNRQQRHEILSKSNCDGNLKTLDVSQRQVARTYISKDNSTNSSNSVINVRKHLVGPMNVRASCSVSNGTQTNGQALGHQGIINNSAAIGLNKNYFRKQLDGHIINSSADSSVTYSGKYVKCICEQNRNVEVSRNSTSGSLNSGQKILNMTGTNKLTSEKQVRNQNKSGFQQNSTNDCQSLDLTLNKARIANSLLRTKQSYHSVNKKAFSSKSFNSMQPSRCNVAKIGSTNCPSIYEQELYYGNKRNLTAKSSSNSRQDSVQVKNKVLVNDPARARQVCNHTLSKISSARTGHNDTVTTNISADLSDNFGGRQNKDHSFSNSSSKFKQELVHHLGTSPEQAIRNSQKRNDSKDLSPIGSSYFSPPPDTCTPIQLLANMVAKATNPDLFSFPTSWGVEVFKEWLIHKGLSPLFEDLKASALDDLLMEFYPEIKAKESSTLFIGALSIIRNAIISHLSSVKPKRKHGRDLLYSNAVFQDLTNETRPITAQGPIRTDDLKKLYQSGVLNDSDPVSLQRKVWFEIMLFMNEQWGNCLNALHSLTKGSFVLHIDKDGKRYYMIVPDVKDKNTNRDVRIDEHPGIQKCPVKSLENYLSKLNPACDAFFQHPLKYVRSYGFWYKPNPLGKGKLKNMMSQISVDARLSRIYTNSAVKTTSVLLLHKR